MSQPPSAQSTALENLNPLDRQESEPAAIASTSAAGEPGFVEAADRFSFENYADRLMDDLFGDLEEALEQGRVVSTEPPEELTAHRSNPGMGAGIPTPVSVADVTIPPILATRSQEPVPEGSWRESSDEWGNPEPGFVPELNPEPALIPQFEREIEREPADDLVTAALQTQPPTIQRKSFDGLLALLVCGSLAAAVAVWYAMQGRWQSAEVPGAPGAAEVAAQPPSPENREFLDYIQRSLQVLESKAARNQAEATGPDAAGNLPSVAVAGNPTTPSSSPAGSNPVIVPVYRPPAGMVLPGRSGGGFPNLPGFSLPGRSPAVSTVPLPQAPTAAPDASSGTSSAAPAPNIAAAATHTLVGILELSDPSRSAALFEIGGTTQRVQVGEPIGSSGWTLVSVKGNEVMVRRNGDVRSIYTGQQF